MGAKEMPPEAIAEAGEAVAEKIDVLLERATDAVLGAPQPGSEAWQRAWAARDTDAGRAELAHRARVKIAIAAAAGVDLQHELERARRAGLADESAAEPRGKPKQRRRPEEGEVQLSML
ncbi:hypothetical protein [Prescottella equi]